MISVRLFVVALVVLVTGCVSGEVTKEADTVVATTYVPANTTLKRTVGRLRRLAVLPVRLEVSPRDPKYCSFSNGPCDWDGYRKTIDAEITGYLSEERGYEIVSLESTVDKKTSENETSEIENTTSLLVEFAENHQAEQPTAEVTTAINQLGDRFKIDGVMVIAGSSRALSKIDEVSWFATFTFSIPITAMRLGTQLKATVFEVQSGSIVWASVAKQGVEWKKERLFRQRPVYELVRELLDPIEPALPGVFALPREGTVHRKTLP